MPIYKNVSMIAYNEPMNNGRSQSLDLTWNFFKSADPSSRYSSTLRIWWHAASAISFSSTLPLSSMCWWLNEKRVLECRHKTYTKFLNYQATISYWHSLLVIVMILILNVNVGWTRIKKIHAHHSIKCNSHKNELLIGWYGILGT